MVSNLIKLSVLIKNGSNYYKYQTCVCSNYCDIMPLVKKFKNIKTHFDR